MKSVAEQIKDKELELADLKAKAEFEKKLQAELLSAEVELEQAQTKVDGIKEELKNLLGKPSKADKQTTGTRTRLTEEEKAEFASKVLAYLKKDKKAHKLGHLHSQFSRHSKSHLREALASLGKHITKTGERAATVYSAK